MDDLTYKNTPYVNLSDIQADNDAALNKIQQEEQQQMEENKTIHEKLSDIQKQLKAPKSQYNSFGKYKYRNCEDILEAIKPYLNGCTLQLSDEIKEIAGMPYVEATAIFTDGQTYIAVKAQAGISVNRKGMDIAQSFGASSSYARKYALAGLFLLDDTKDADSQDNRTNNVTDIANAIKDNGEPFLMEQRTEEWFNARLGKVTASKVSDVLAKIKTGEAAMRRNYKMQLATERLTGQKTDSYFNQAMQDGIDREDTAREIYEIVRDIKVEQVGFIDHPTIKMAGASPDGLLPDGGILEIKCPVETTHTTNLLERKLPSRYIPQVQWQLACAGKDYKYANFVSYNPNFEPKLQLMYVEVERDNEYIEMLEEEVSIFLLEVDEVINTLRELNKE